jgi:AraC-like DNA-binding protein/DNA-binding MarR family transcriptional regulator
MDVLADFLKTAGITAQVESLPNFDQSLTHSGAAAVSSTGNAQLSMLCVAAGEYSMFDHQSRSSLTSGDVVFLSPGSSYRIESLRAESTLIVGSIVFRAGEMALATLNLPSATILRGQEHPESRDLAMRLATEVQLARGGWQQVAECLATSLFITSLRATESSEPNQGSGQGWLRALVDPEIGNALRLMHQSPEYRWTVAELADQLSISRSAFAERFKRITGRPPLEYLTWWRLQRAAARLRSGEVATMFELARNSGYQSEAAFSKAFRREFGVAPGELRRQALAQKATPSLLQLEIKKRNPFELPEQEAGLNLAKSFEAVRRPFDELMRSYDLSGAEYNILRILRGKNCPMTIDEVLSHLLIPLTNLPEHLEKLVSKQLVNHLVGSDQWEISIQGKSVLTKLDEPTLSLHRRQFASFSAGEIAEFNRLLVKLRTPAS